VNCFELIFFVLHLAIAIAVGLLVGSQYGWLLGFSAAIISVVLFILVLRVGATLWKKVGKKGTRYF